MPTPLKDPKKRARRNKTATRATLSLVPSDVDVPELPERAIRHPETGEPIPVPWHPQALAFWADAWSSPMAPEWLKADTHGLFILATLVDGYWRRIDEGKVSAAKELAAEIRLQRQCFGLTPMDRRRLEWEIERVEDAQEKGRKRRQAPRKAPKRDPRKHLAAVE